MEIDATTADSGAKAIELVKQNDYDIVFMDQMMPGMDGVETVRNIRALGGKYEKLNIIALTANAVTGAREMFLNNGFDDFISKPINADELKETVKKYLSSDKIKSKKTNENQQVVLDREEQLRRKTIIIFVKENRNTFEKITNFLSTGDIKAAHIIAHTLKSSAGYLGKKDLQKAAFLLEEALKNGTPDYSPEQLVILGRELSAALLEFEGLVEEALAQKPVAVHIDAREKAALLAELRPMLEKADFGATNYVEKLQGIIGLEELAQLIDDYDFKGSLKALDLLEQK
jgi:CheY-like chemotaxis protein